MSVYYARSTQVVNLLISLRAKSSVKLPTSGFVGVIDGIGMSSGPFRLRWYLYALESQFVCYAPPHSLSLSLSLSRARARAHTRTHTHARARKHTHTHTLTKCCSEVTGLFPIQANGPTVALALLPRSFHRLTPVVLSVPSKDGAVSFLDELISASKSSLKCRLSLPVALPPSSPPPISSFSSVWTLMVFGALRCQTHWP